MEPEQEVEIEEEITTEIESLKLEEEGTMNQHVSYAVKTKVSKRSRFFLILYLLF
jgi:hypothetical protein